MTIQDLLELGIKELRRAKIDNPQWLAKKILANEIDKNITYLAIHNKEEIDDKTKEKFKLAIIKKQNGIPLQYITHKQDFMGLCFYVDENVLIPRVDTEILVEEVIEIAKNTENIKILDMCTGSGAIAISLAKYLPNAKISASDKSIKALKIAKENAKNNNVKIDFIESDLFKNINHKYDIVVSNPPYIETEVIKTLDVEVQNEPLMALDGGKDGLDFYRIIANEVKEYLNKDGYLAFEIGYNQREAVTEILNKEGYVNIYSKKDYGGNNRIVVGKK